MSNTPDSANNPRSEMLGNAPVTSLMIKFAVPSIIAMLVGALYNIVDQLFIGQAAGQLGNAATNIAFPFSTSCLSLALLFGIGGASCFNLSMGRGDRERAPYFVGNAVLMMLICGVMLMAVTQVFLTPLLKLFGSMIGRSDKNGPKGSGVNEDVSFTLNATDRHAVAFSPARVYSTSKNSYHTEATENVAGTLVASDYKDPPTVAEEPQYIVRRLMPTECARLQGFPDWWCADLGTAEPTDGELEFWRQVFETHRNITSGSKKAKSDKQLRAWLKSPHSDSAEYKLRGNGVALPGVFFVRSGIVYYSQSNVESL